MKYTDEELKLIYVLKIGHNSKGNGLYELIFSNDPTNINIEEWCWDMSPACDNAIPPTKNHIDELFTIKTNSFDFFCLHEAVDREYMHGYHTIHALAYEIEKENNDSYDDYEDLFEKNVDDLPLLVFHYGMSLAQIKTLLFERKMILRKKEFIEVSEVEIK